VITGYMYTDVYKSELEELTYPSDGAQTNPYAFYDRYTHQFHTATESDTVQEGWGFAAIVALAAQSNAGKTAWKAKAGTITSTAGKTVTAKVTSSDVDLSSARVTWEAAGVEPFVGGTTFTFTPSQTGTIWIDAEAMLPDGRRVVAATQVTN